MTYEQLKNKFEELTQVSLDLKDTGNYMILEESGIELMAFNKHSGYERHFHINTISIHSLLNLYDEDNYKKMWEIIFSLIDTPADERFLEQKYYVKLDLPIILRNERQYLNKVTTHKKWGKVVHYELSSLEWFSRAGDVDYQTQFTMKEIESIKKHIEDDLCKFELIPVEEVK